jgi:hypothetical protein
MLTLMSAPVANVHREVAQTNAKRVMPPIKAAIAKANVTGNPNCDGEFICRIRRSGWISLWSKTAWGFVRIPRKGITVPIDNASATDAVSARIISSESCKRRRTVRCDESRISRLSREISSFGTLTLCVADCYSKPPDFESSVAKQLGVEYCFYIDEHPV